jgi:hypothetical protein
LIVSTLSQPGEKSAMQQLALQPLFNGATRLLGQVSGLLLLAHAGGDPDRQRQHLANARLQWRDFQDARSGLGVSKSAAGVTESLSRLGVLLDRLERRFARSLHDDHELRLMLDEIAAIRRLLQESSCPRHGLALVDFAGACCAGGH